MGKVDKLWPTLREQTQTQLAAKTLKSIKATMGHTVPNTSLQNFVPLPLTLTPTPSFRILSTMSAVAAFRSLSASATRRALVPRALRSLSTAAFTRPLAGASRVSLALACNARNPALQRAFSVSARRLGEGSCAWS